VFGLRVIQASDLGPGVSERDYFLPLAVEGYNKKCLRIVGSLEQVQDRDSLLQAATDL